ncbi:MAG: hypothetical protein QOH57_2289 [Mycobacterium sp.]|jgi:hypothetical protein|nr:hypothetical protein [Mycobacterium sp.]
MRRAGMRRGWKTSSDESDMTESARPNRDEELENIVDELDQNVSQQREAEDVPGKPSEREQKPPQGSADEPTA